MASTDAAALNVNKLLIGLSSPFCSGSNPSFWRERRD
jgi:hypothetical protein